MATNTLTDISGIGAAAAARLVEAGFNTVEDVAKASVDVLGAVKGMGTARAARVIASAQSLLDTPVEATAAETTAEPAKKPTASAAPANDKKTDEKAGDTVKADPVVAATSTGRFKSMAATLRKPKVFVPAVIVVAIAAVAAANPVTVSSYYAAAKANFANTAMAKLALQDEGVAPSKAASTAKAETKTAMQPAFDMAAPLPIATPVTMPAARPTGMGAVQAVRPTDMRAMPVARPYYPGNGWGNGPWGNNGYGAGNGALDGSFSMSFSGNSAMRGNGYGYNAPYYGYAPYGYAPAVPYGYPRPMAYQVPAAPAKAGK